VKKLSTIQRFKKNKGGFAKARKASKKIKTIAGRLVREIERKLESDDANKYAMDLSLFKKVLAQKRSDSNKTYSLHEPEVNCYTKGKEHKKFEFGSKASFLITQNTNVVVGALNFSDNVHDSKTLPAVIEQYERLMNKSPKQIFLDRGYRGPKMINNTALHTPKPDKNITKAKRKRHSRRAAIEPVIGHLKHDYRMARNYLKGTVGDAMNVMLAASAMNFKRMMNKWKEQLVFLALRILQLLNFYNNMFVNRKLKFTF
jgi:transposase, IS5 family